MIGREEVLQVNGLTKIFPGVRALTDLSLTVAAGEILAVVGQNGSGKSTFVKCLAGVYQPDSGTITVPDGAGGRIDLRQSPQAVSFIHQDLGLVDALSTVENLGLGRRLAGAAARPIRWRAEKAHARQLIARFGAVFDVTAPVSSLSAAERTIVAIARAFDGWAGACQVLVLDEPTAALHGQEVDDLFHAIGAAREQGTGIIYISHRLDEVLGLADRVVALRDGRRVADIPREKLDHDSLIAAIVGRPIESMSRPDSPAAGNTVLDVQGLTAPGLEGVSFEARAGEVLGVTGLLGSGRETVAAAVFGAIPRTEGTVMVSGSCVPVNSPRASILRGMTFAPADRRAAGAVTEMTVKENLTLADLKSVSTWYGSLSSKREREEVGRWVQALDIRPPDPAKVLSLLSGGNQQKVILGKWLRTRPRVLLLDEPTQGVDVGAKAAIHELLRRAARDGAAVIVSSSDTQELASLCDRVLVMRAGGVAKVVDKADLSESLLLRESLVEDSMASRAASPDVEGASQCQ